jgi:hypothetical protein
MRAADGASGALKEAAAGGGGGGGGGGGAKTKKARLEDVSPRLAARQSRLWRRRQ